MGSEYTNTYENWLAGEIPEEPLLVRKNVSLPGNKTLQAIQSGMNVRLAQETMKIPLSHVSLYNVDVQPVLTNETVNSEDVRNPEAFQIITLNEGSEDFKETDYSLMKYGCGTVAIRYGTKLAEAYIDAHRSTLETWDPASVVVTSSAYKVAPTASNIVMQGFLARLNRFFLEMQKGPAHPVHISRLSLASGDYGNLTEAQRMQRMRHNKLYVDPAQIQGKHVLIVDDAYITGAHERNVRELLDEQKPASLTFLYIVKLKNGVGGKFPKVEDRINHAAIHKVTDIFTLMRRPDFVPNDRVCKGLLSRIDSDTLQKELCDVIDDGYGWHVLTLERMALGNGYAGMPEYRQAYQAIHHALLSRGYAS